MQGTKSILSSLIISIVKRIGIDRESSPPLPTGFLRHRNDNKDRMPACQVLRLASVGTRAIQSACILFMLVVTNSFALDALERVFVWNEANAIMQNAKTPVDYLQAARIYQRLVDDGVRNGPLFYNMGMALLAADRYEQALNAFERAECYLGWQPDIERNMKIAAAKKSKSRTVDLPWYRLAAFWHYYLSCPQRTYIASFAFLAFWLAIILQRIGLKKATNALAGISLVVFIVFATSVAASWQMENSAARYNLDGIQPALMPTNTTSGSVG